MSIIKWEMLDGNVENAEVWGRTIGAIYHNDNKMEFMCETYMSTDKELFLELWDGWFLGAIARKEADYKYLKIQGYTAEQWQEIIKGKYLCEFTDGYWEDGYSDIGALVNVPDVEQFGKIASMFERVRGRRWIHCRPSQAKWVARPIFVEPADKDVKVTIFDAAGIAVWDGRWDKKPNDDSAVKYIEV